VVIRYETGTGERFFRGYNVRDIRGRPGFDVVGSPAELQAEVAGWPRKSTGNNASAKNDLALAA
jgi:hypothetical protein